MICLLSSSAAVQLILARPIGFPLFARQMFSRLGTFGASALLAGLVTCMLPLPFVFYRIGGRIRERSKFGTGSKVADAEEKSVKA